MNWKILNHVTKSHFEEYFGVNIQMKLGAFELFTSKAPILNGRHTIREIKMAYAEDGIKGSGSFGCRWGFSTRPLEVFRLSTCL